MIKYLKKFAKTQQVVAEINTPQTYDDFDFIVEEVSNNPYNVMS